MPEIDARTAAANTLMANLTPFQMALAIIDAATPAGSSLDWDSATIEYVTQPLNLVVLRAGLPDLVDQNITDANYWRTVGRLDPYTDDDFDL